MDFKEWKDEISKRLKADKEVGFFLSGSKHLAIYDNKDNPRIGVATTDEADDPKILHLIAYSRLNGVEVPKLFPTFKGVAKGEKYYTIRIDNGIMSVKERVEDDNNIDWHCLKKNNYFKSTGRAIEAANRIAFHLKLERLYDKYCSDDINWRISADPCIIDYDIESQKYVPKLASHCGTLDNVYFSSYMAALKACEELNSEDKMTTFCPVDKINKEEN